MDGHAFTVGATLCAAALLVAGITVGAENPAFITLDEMSAPAPAVWEKPMPTGCPAFTIALPRAKADAKVVKAADFGLSESSRLNGAAIRRAVVEAKRLGASRIELAPGRYMCHDAFGILVDGLTDVTFDGLGATLVFYRPARYTPSWALEGDGEHPRSNFLLRDCQRVKFGNLKLDWDWSIDPLATFCRVQAVNLGGKKDGSSFVDFEVLSPKSHPCRGKTIPVQTIVEMTEKCDGFGASGTTYLATYEGDTGSKSVWLDPTHIRVWPNVPPTAPDSFVSDEARTRRYKVEDNYWNAKHFEKIRGRPVRIAHHYYGKGAIVMDSCVDLTLKDIRIYSTFGMGFVVAGKQHHWALEDCIIAPPAGEMRPICVTADSLHVINSRGYAKVSGFSTCLNQDDICNFHDKTSAAKRSGPRKLAFTHRRANPYFGAKAGDWIELRQLNYEPTGIHAQVVRATDSELELDRDIPEAKYESYILSSDAYATDNLIFRNSRFENTCGRCCLMGNNVTVENCTFKDQLRIIFKFQAALMIDQWAEGHGMTNVVVRGCRFENCQRTLGATYGKTVAESFVGRNLRKCYSNGKTDGLLDVPDYTGIVSGILYENNTWVCPRVPIIHALCASDVTVRNNTLVLGNPQGDKVAGHRGEIISERSVNVRAYGNRIVR